MTSEAALLFPHSPPVTRHLSEGVKKFEFNDKTASSPQPSPPKEEREKKRTPFFFKASHPLCALQWM